MLYHFIDVKCLEKTNLQRQKVHSWLPGIIMGMGTDYKWGTKDGFLWGDRNVLKLDYGYCAKTL